MDALGNHVTTLLNRQKYVGEYFLYVVVHSVIQGRARKLNYLLAYKRPRYLLNEKVVGMPAREVDVEAKSPPAGH